MDHRAGVRFSRALVAFAFASCAGLACAGAGLDVDGLLGGAAPGGEARVVAGLKQALEVGTERAVARTSGPDGFLADPRIRIPLPDALDGMARALRAVGLGARVDELDVAMNRAAERAAAEATPVFWDAIQRMSFSDARAILRGGDTAATDYFERTTRDPLTQRFAPIVEARMREVGLVRLYDDLVARYVALPFAGPPPPDLDEYVTGRTLAGLFVVLGEEERRIREDPAARTTALLKEVFR